MSTSTDINEQAEGLNINSFLRRCLRNWYFVVLAVAVAGGFAWWTYKSKTPIYSVSSKVLIDPNQATSLDPQGIITPLASGVGGTLTDEIEIIKSRQLMARVVENLNLELSYYIETQFGRKEIYNDERISVSTFGSLDPLYGRSATLVTESNNRILVILDKKDTLSGQNGQTLRVEGLNLVIKMLPDAEPVELVFNSPLVAGLRYINNLSVDQIKRSRVLQLSLKDAFPARASLILKELVNEYDSYVLNNNRRSANITVQFIDQRLDLITKELFDVEKEVEDYKKEIDVPLTLDKSASDFLLEVRTNDRALSELNLIRTLLNEIRKKLQEEFTGYDYIPITLELGGASFRTTLINSYNDLVAQRNKLLVSAKEENPVVQMTNKELEKARSNILKWIEIKQDEIQTREVFLNNELDPLEDKIQDVPQYERELLQIMRQQEIKESLFTYLLQRREETAIALAAEVTNTRVVDNPITGGRVSPNRNRIYLMHLVIGMMIPLAIIFLIELLDTKIHNEKELKEISPLPFVGGVPKSKQKGLLAGKEEGKSIASEMLRLIRTNLSFVIPKLDRGNVVLVTSSKSGEGKTFFSLNLAMSFAQSGKKVLVVELDLRKPRVQEYIGMERDDSDGISKFLSGKYSDISSITKKVDGVKNLSFTPSGPIPPNPSELIILDQMDQFLEQARAQFDLIILDTPPIGLVTDALLFKDRVEASIFVTRADYTTKSDLAILHDVQRENKLPNIAVCLNGVKVGRGYGNYRQYGYYETKKGNWMTRLMRKG